MHIISLLPTLLINNLVTRRTSHLWTITIFFLFFWWEAGILLSVALGGTFPNSDLIGGVWWSLHLFTIQMIDHKFCLGLVVDSICHFLQTKVAKLAVTRNEWGALHSYFCKIWPILPNSIVQQVKAQLNLEFIMPAMFCQKEAPCLWTNVFHYQYTHNNK